MKSILTSNFTFNAAARQINFSTLPGFDVRKLIAVLNITRNQLIYAAGEPDYGFAGETAGVVTLVFNTTAHADNDKLLVYYDSEFTMSGSVSVSNFPATQPVSGSVSVSNFPADNALTDTQLRATPLPVSAASLPLPTGAATESTLSSLNTNLGTDGATPPTITGTGIRGWLRGIYEKLAATLTISGSVSVSNFPGTQPISGSVSVSNLPATQPVSGSVSVSNFPADNALTDTQLRATPVPMSVSNFPATQPVSAASLPLPAGAATESTLSILNTNTPTLGIKQPSGSRPVVLSEELTVTGPSALSVVNTNLLTGNVSDWYDAIGYNSATIQIIASAGISSGQVFFEQTNDSSAASAGVPLPAYEVSVQNANPNIAAFSIAANSIRMFNVAVTARYIRVRISTVFAGGTIRAVALLSQLPFSWPTVNIQQATAANLNTTVSGTVTVNALPAGTNAIGDTGIQYRANEKGAASKAHLVSAATTNATVAKASAGRLLGWSLANTTASFVYLKLHNQSTSPTAGASIFMTIALPPNSLAQLQLPGGIAFSTGIAFTTVTGSADADTTAVGAGAIVGDLFYA